MRTRRPAPDRSTAGRYADELRTAAIIAVAAAMVMGAALFAAPTVPSWARWVGFVGLATSGLVVLAYAVLLVLENRADTGESEP